MTSTQNSNQDRKPKASTSPRNLRVARWLPVFAALLVINYWAGSQAMEGESRVRVPYSPFFIEQVRAGNVVEITSTGTAIQGTFARPASYDGSEPTTRFRTEIPAFARAIFRWIEAFYNPTRRHSTLGYLSPLDFETAGAA